VVSGGWRRGCVYALIALGFVLHLQGYRRGETPPQGEFVMGQRLSSATRSWSGSAPVLGPSSFADHRSFRASWGVGPWSGLVVRPHHGRPDFSASSIATIGASTVLPLPFAGIIYGYDVLPLPDHLLQGIPFVSGP